MGYFNIIFIYYSALFLFLAPSRAPKITRKKLKGKSVNIAWEHVEPLANEASINGYKVSEIPMLTVIQIVISRK